ncbi:hypothetical protein FBUS_09274 [Fasciolopsis buskii]|uniref:Uncharacterized protein n=1 Tax=Fasciolopsis buskii TaxID=27845 RepID=A0A8E0RU32_9TREM|nr:hypothetical protein FBUS_09274 [Fasciolopsis buski]
MSLPYYARNFAYVLWTNKPLENRKRPSKSPLLTWIRTKPPWMNISTRLVDATKKIPSRSTSMPLATPNENCRTRDTREKSPMRLGQSSSHGHRSRIGMRSVAVCTSRATSVYEMGSFRSTNKSALAVSGHGHSNTSSLDRFIEKSRLWAGRAPLARMEHTHITSPSPLRSTVSVLYRCGRDRQKQLIRSSMDKLDKTRTKRRGLF